MFNERLIEYRNEQSLSKRDFAERLDVSEGYYNLIENGKRSPSKNFIEKLVIDSCRPEEYWLYGIDKKEYINSRDDFKCLKKAVEQLLDLNLISDLDDIFKGNYEKGTLEELLVMAVKADIKHIIDKKNRNGRSLK